MKTAIVTGAARGIGLATTRLFLEEGWQVAMIDRDAMALADAVTALDNVHPIDCDVSDPGPVEGMVAETLTHFGRIDALINPLLQAPRDGAEKAVLPIRKGREMERRVE